MSRERVLFKSDDPEFSRKILEELNRPLDNDLPVSDLEDSENEGENADFIFSDHETDSEQDEVSDNESDTDNRHPSDVYRGRGKNRIPFIWGKQKPRLRGRAPAHNIISHLPGLRNEANALVTRDINPLGLWKLLIPDSMIEKVVNYTNIHLETYRGNFQDPDRTDLRYVDIVEMKAYLGLLLLTSISKSGRESMSSLFSADGHGRDIFRCTMSMKRFFILTVCIRFDDRNTREMRRQQDPTAAVNEIWADFISNSQRMYSIGQNACVDEMIVPFRGRCKFRVYMPNKPAKYGMKVLCLTDARNNYLFNAYLYGGKNTDGIGLSNEEKKLGIPTQSVIRLVKPIGNTNRNITCDNWFMSMELLRELRNRGLTVLGTLRSNKPEIPTEFLPNRNRAPGSSIFGFTSTETLVSYVPKKNKAVLLLSSCHHDDKCDELSGKPDIIIDYNSFKGGVDNLDKKCAIYSCNRRTRRWSLALFFALLDISANNAYVLFSDSRERVQMDRFRFIKTLGDSLIEEHLQRRSVNLRLPRDLRQKIQAILGISPEVAGPCLQEGPPKKKRCYICPRNKDRKTAKVCTKCKQNVCVECSVPLCKNCV